MGGYSTRLPPRVAVAAAPIASAPAAAAPAPPMLPAAPAAPSASAPAAAAQPPPAPPPRPWLPSQSGAADQNAYRERLADRESNRWGKRSEVLQPEASSLVHAWTYYLSIYPPAALTIWLRRTIPIENSYDLFVSGESFIGESYPDRKLYETIRSMRRQPNIAETFTGRIQGRSSEGQPLDVGGGDLRLPPEPNTQPAQWGQPASPWGAPPMYGAPGMMGAPPPPWGAPSPWGALPMGGGYPYGAPPWWAMMPQAPAPPPAIAHDPAAVEMWRAMKEMQIAAAHSTGEHQALAMKLQTTLLEKLFDRLGSPAQSSGGSMKETIDTISAVAGLVNNLRGGGDKDAASDALQIVETKQGDKIFSTHGKVHEGLTYSFAVKDAATELLKGFRSMRTRAPASAPGATIEAPPVGRAGVSGGGLPARGAPAAPTPPGERKP